MPSYLFYSSLRICLISMVDVSSATILRLSPNITMVKKKKMTQIKAVMPMVSFKKLVCSIT